ncbi:MAG: MFS transporter [Arenicellales bacterium]|nr:MFS transporter [Arenicellales bacterium]
MSRREALMFLNTAHFFDHLFLLIFPTAAIAIAAEWGLTYGEALALGTPVYVMFAFGTLPAGWLGDRFDRTLLIAFFFVACGTSSLLISLSTGPKMLMLGLGLLGLFAALYHPIGLALVPDIADRTGRALAVNGVFGNMGLAAGALITGFLAARGGWQSAFLLPGAVSMVLGCALCLRRLRSGAPPTRHEARSYAAIEPAPRGTQIVVFVIVCVAALFGGLVFNAITVSLPKFFDERLVTFGGDLAWIGASTGLVFAVAAFAQLPVGELLDRFGARAILFCLLTAQILLLLGLSHLQGWTALALAMLLVTLIFAEIPITSWLLGCYVRSGLRARALSVEYVLSLGVGSAVVPLIAGMHHIGLGFDIQFVGFAGSAFVVLIAAWFLPRHRFQHSVSAGKLAT